MAIPVGVADVERVLRPWLGTLFLSANPLAADVAAHMRAYAPYRQRWKACVTSWKACFW